MKSDRSLLLEVASLFYKEGLSQQEIAARLYFSPSKVSRLMKQAVEQGAVEININYPNQRVEEQERALIKHFGLKEARVLKTIALSADAGLYNFGEFAAAFIKDQLRDNDRIGVSSGRTLRAAIKALPLLDRRNVEVLQLKGMANQENKLNDDCPVLVRMLSEHIQDAHYQLLYSPLYIENKIARECLIHEEMICQTLRSYQNLDMILTSVSFFSKTEKSAWASFISDEEYRELFNKGTKTSFLGHFINARGEIVSSEREQKQIGISLDEVRRCRNTVLLALGERKAEAVSAALHSHGVDSLLIDSRLAEALLRLNGV